MIKISLCHELEMTQPHDWSRELYKQDCLLVQWAALDRPSLLEQADCWVLLSIAPYDVRWCHEADEAEVYFNAGVAMLCVYSANIEWWEQKFLLIELESLQYSALSHASVPSRAHINCWYWYTGREGHYLVSQNLLLHVGNQGYFALLLFFYSNWQLQFTSYLYHYFIVKFIRY